jgi:hypothetical protein
VGDNLRGPRDEGGNPIAPPDDDGGLLAILK